MELDGALMLLLLAAGLFVIALAAWPLAAIGLILSYKLGGAWRNWRRRFAVILAIATLILLVGIANALWSAWTAPGSDEDQTKAAAVAKVRAQFADPKAVQIQKLWMGEKERFELTVCGVADSDELANPTEFIFTTRFTAPPLDFDKPEAGREGDDLILQYPPSLEGTGQKDAAYWEKFMNGADGFLWRWRKDCAKTEPVSKEGETK